MANVVDHIKAAYDLSLDEVQRSIALQAIRFGLGIIPGALYGVLNDEYLNTRLGLSGPFEAYPLATHWRGLVGHAVLAVATDTGIDRPGG